MRSCTDKALTEAVAGAWKGITKTKEVTRFSDRAAFDNLLEVTQQMALILPEKHQVLQMLHLLKL